jgi:hypothetical protein
MGPGSLVVMSVIVARRYRYSYGWCSGEQRTEDIALVQAVGGDN